ncbi:MAG: hypothetical protein NTW90_06805 [Nitrosospira sp.]|nr:hypothetical protein [Nitrosospira sp.]
MIDVTHLKAICLTAKAERLALFIDPLNAAMEEFEINTPLRQAAFLSQLAHESGQFRYMEELATGEAYDHRADLGNTKPQAILIAQEHGSTPGKWWKGHGPIQITGFDNHMACGIALGLDLMNSPKLIAEPEGGCRAAGWFWRTHGLNKLADEGGITQITRRINGGTNGIAERLQFYARAKVVLGVK